MEHQERQGKEKDKKRIHLIKLLKELEIKLGRTPDIYDWVISTDEQWWDCFRSWSGFLKQSGLSERKIVILPEPGERKLCEVLKTLDNRAGRLISRDEWAKLVDGCKTEEKYPSFQRYFGLYEPRYWHRTWNTQAYLNGLPVRNTRYLGNKAAGEWLSFRYFADPSAYELSDLLDMGIKRLRAIASIDTVNCKELELFGKKTYQIEIDGVCYSCDKEEFVTPQSAKELMADSAPLTVFCFALPHRAIYDYFGTLENYIEAVFDAKERQETAAQVQAERVETERHQDDYENQTVDELLSTMKLLAEKLSKKLGMNVQVQITL